MLEVASMHEKLSSYLVRADRVAAAAQLANLTISEFDYSPTIRQAAAKLAELVKDRTYKETGAIRWWVTTAVAG